MNYHWCLFLFLYLNKAVIYDIQIDQGCRGSAIKVKTVYTLRGCCGGESDVGGEAGAVGAGEAG